MAGEDTSGRQRLLKAAFETPPPTRLNLTYGAPDSDGTVDTQGRSELDFTERYPSVILNINKQKVKVLVDTGSGTTWVAKNTWSCCSRPDQKCSDFKNGYDEKKGELKQGQEDFYIKYDEEWASGTLIQATVVLGADRGVDLVMGFAEKGHMAFSQGECGVLGLHGPGAKIGERKQTSPLWIQLIESQSPNLPKIFGLSLKNKLLELGGGLDNRAGKVSASADVYHNSDKGVGHWWIGIKDILFRDTDELTPINVPGKPYPPLKVAIDTGSRETTLPDAIADAINEKLGPTNPNWKSQKEGRIAVDCKWLKSNARLGIRLETDIIGLPPAYFIESAGPGQPCYSAVRRGGSLNPGVFGAPFLEFFETIEFDTTTNVVKFTYN